ncbi:hypothetical protein J3R83DRAFT_3015 [Lanmaoa asiatica]|nr:hypothetical protein J3R83DRAFT_3015 [Lanmaoa asiatica]
MALPFCILRLWIRIRMQRVGWEDIYAAVAFVCGMVNVVSDWIYVMQSGVGESSMISMWIYVITLISLLWAVRISIIFSIIRIIPARERLHIYGLMIVAVFLLAWLGWVILGAIQCNNAVHAFQSTPSDPYFRCSAPRSLVISQMAVGNVADIIAVVFPLHVLRRITLPPGQHRLLRPTILIQLTGVNSVLRSHGMPARSKAKKLVPYLEPVFSHVS